MTHLPKELGITQAEEDKSLIIRQNLSISAVMLGAMNKSRTFLPVYILILSFISIPSSSAAPGFFEIPKVESFSVSSDSIELASTDATLEFSLKVSHPIGITSTKTILWFKSRDNKTQLSTELIRQPQVAGKFVIFSGKLKFVTSIPTGIYDFYAESIEGISGIGVLGNPKTGDIYPEKFNLFLDAEKSVLVRLGGELNLNTKTFVGPTYSSSVSLTDDKPLVFSSNPPIFKVGEFYNPLNFFVIRVPGMKLKLSSTSPRVCIESEEKLKFIGVGTCNFTLYTEKNKDYLMTMISLSYEISSARVEPRLTIPSILPQKAVNLPRKIDLGLVYNTAAELVIPVTLTPTVCVPSGLSILTIVSGGQCTLTYQSTESNTYLASDIYTLTFEVIRDPQTITFTLPSTANVSTRSIALSATASSGGAITYSTTSAGICSITGSTLNLLRNGNCAVTATQAGTSTLAPASATATVVLSGAAVGNRKTITCVKGKSTKKVSGVNPKCPKGFKIKR